MKMKRWIRKIVPVVSAVMLMLSGGIEVYAAQEGSLTVQVSYKGEDISGAELAVYKVQRWESPESGKDPEWCGDFADFGSQTISGKAIGSLRGGKAEFVNQVASRLQTYIEENNISALKTGITGDNGRQVFSSLEPGVYLVIVTQQPEGYIITSPFLVTVPIMDADGGMDYQVTVEAKIQLAATPEPTRTPAPPGPTSNPTPGPTSYPTANPTSTPGPTSTPQPGSTPAPTSSPAASVSPSPAQSTPAPTDQPRVANRTNPAPSPTPEPAVLGMRRRRGFENGVLGKRRLPQTGTLQWPIPVLAVTGILLFLAGWMRKYGKKNEIKKKARCSCARDRS